MRDKTQRAILCANFFLRRHDQPASAALQNFSATESILKSSKPRPALDFPARCQRSAAESNANGAGDGAIRHQPIRRRRENPRAHIMSTGSWAIFMEAVSVVGREEEPIGSKRVTVHLAEIIGDLAGAGVGVLELQNRLLHFAGGQAHLDGAAVVGRGELFGVRARMSSEGVLRGASGRVLPADVKVHGEIAVVADVGITSRTGCDGGVCGDGVAAVRYGWSVGCGRGVHNPGWAGWDGGG